MKKESLSKARMAVVTYGAATAIAGLVLPTVTEAASCTAGSATAGVTCSFAANDYSGLIATAFNFTGSTNVTLNIAGSSNAFGVCASHAQGTSSYGFSLSGSSKNTTSTGTAANSTSGCN